jgi:arylsulfatase
MGDWKLLAQRPRHGTGAWELYNLANDPSERDDLAAQMPERLATMEKAFRCTHNRS